MVSVCLITTEFDCAKCAMQRVTKIKKQLVRYCPPDTGLHFGVHAAENKLTDDALYSDTASPTMSPEAG